MATNRFGPPPWGPNLSLQLVEQLRERTGKLAAELANGMTAKTEDIIEAIRLGANQIAIHLNAEAHRHLAQATKCTIRRSCFALLN